MKNTKNKSKKYPCIHVWREITSNNNGIPKSYQCINCNMVYEVLPKDKYVNEYMAQKYDLVINRMNENHRKIIRLNQIHKSEGIQLVIDYLDKENKQLLKLIR